MPAAAAYAAAEADVFPVDAQMIAELPSSIAFETATTMPRSLNEPVGLAPSSFAYNCSTPSSAPSRPSRTSGVKPSPTLSSGVAHVTGRNSRYRSTSRGRTSVIDGVQRHVRAGRQDRVERRARLGQSDRFGSKRGPLLEGHRSGLVERVRQALHLDRRHERVPVAR